MDMTSILIPVGIMAGLGAVFGAVLAVFGKLLAVPRDERVDAIRAALPGANCGGCGYPGCDGLAAAVASGAAAVDACPVGGSACAVAIAGVMGVAVPDPSQRQVAMVLCQGGDKNCKEKYDYTGPADCRAAVQVAGGAKACRYACLGLGTCVSACAFGAITVSGGIAVIDPARCTACRKCMEACPKEVIALARDNLQVLLRCRSALRGNAVRESCVKGCLACGKCARLCEFGAITLRDNLPVFDLATCTGCGACARACPTGAICDLNPRDDFVTDGEKREAFGGT